MRLTQPLLFAAASALLALPSAAEARPVERDAPEAPSTVQLSVANLVAGDTATWTVTGAVPGGPVLIAYSFAGPGPTVVPTPPCPGLTWGLSHPMTTLAYVFADASGTAVVSIPVAPNSAGTPVWYQALDELSCGLSNTLEEVIGGGGGGGLTLTVTNAVAGQTASCNVTGASPWNTVRFAYSTKGAGPTSFDIGGCGTLVSSLGNGSPGSVVVLGQSVATAAGAATFTKDVPVGVSGATVWVQAFDVASCSFTNPVSFVVG